jgi:hypothetical protein
MSREQMQQFMPEPPQTEAERLVGLRNDMQVKLALRNDEEFEEFLDKHALAFKEAVEADQSILDKYAENPDAALEEVEAIIYH